MEKAVASVAMAEGLQLSKRTIAAIAEASHGDIRCAINALQFQCRHGGADTKYAQWGSRDVSLTLFHAVGKVLYCKRAQDDSSRLESSPESVIDGCLCATPRQIVDIAFENYPSFFSSIGDAAEALECLSFGDALSETNRRQWRSDTLLDELQPLLEIRGFMLGNKHAADVPHSFQAMCKASCGDVSRLAAANAAVLAEISRALTSVSAIPRVLPLWILARRDVQMYVVPYASLVPGSLDFCQAILDRRQFFSQKLQQRLQQQQHARQQYRSKMLFETELVDAIDEYDDEHKLTTVSK